MTALKTLPNNDSVTALISSLENPTRKADAFTLLDIFSTLTKETPKLWGSSIIGFGQYHYKSERSAQEGDWPLIAFSPRKQNLSLYVLSTENNYSELLSKLGKHKTGKGCLYINTLSDIDIKILQQLILQSYQDAQQHHLS